MIDQGSRRLRRKQAMTINLTQPAAFMFRTSCLHTGRPPSRFPGGGSGIPEECIKVGIAHPAVAGLDGQTGVLEADDDGICGRCALLLAIQYHYITFHYRKQLSHNMATVFSARSRYGKTRKGPPR
jgi:hypothetical protein